MLTETQAACDLEGYTDKTEKEMPYKSDLAELIELKGFDAVVPISSSPKVGGLLDKYFGLSFVEREDFLKKHKDSLSFSEKMRFASIIGGVVRKADAVSREQVSILKELGVNCTKQKSSNLICHDNKKTRSKY